MTRRYETIIHRAGEVVLEATLDEDDLLDAIEEYGPPVTSGERQLAPKTILAFAVLAEGFWTYKEFGIMAMRVD